MKGTILKFMIQKAITWYVEPRKVYHSICGIPHHLKSNLQWQITCDNRQELSIVLSSAAYHD